MMRNGGAHARNAETKGFKGSRATELRIEYVAAPARAGGQTRSIPSTPIGHSGTARKDRCTLSINPGTDQVEVRYYVQYDWVRWSHHPKRRNFGHSGTCAGQHEYLQPRPLVRASPTRILCPLGRLHSSDRRDHKSQCACMVITVCTHTAA